MSYLDEASLIMIPSGYKEDKIFTQLPEDGSGDLTFARASDGTRVNSEGYIERVPWNLLQYSNTFSNGAWTKLRSNVVSGQIDKDGGTNAWKFNDSTDTATHRLDFVLTLTDNAPYTFSCYAKAGEHNTLGVEIGGFSVGGNYVLFHLNNGTKTESGTVISSSITSVGNGWYYCVISTNAGAADRLCTQVQTDSTGSYTGTGSNGIYIQNAQLNEGPTAKPYIATTNRQDVPRLDYSNGCPCLLLEPQRTNLVTYSEQFDNAAWAKGAVTITANTAISPDGTQNAETLTETTTSAQHQLFAAAAGYVSGLGYVFSIYAKANTAYVLQLTHNNAFSSNLYANFDLQNGVVGSYGAGTVASIENAGGGWYRCTMYGVATATASGSFMAVLVNNNPSASRRPVYLGVGNGLYIYGAQLEQSSYVTSYIPTTSAAVTRLADAAYKTGISSLINSQEGTMFIQTRANTNNTGTSVLSISNGTASNTLYFGFSTTTNSWVCQLVTGGVAQTNFTGVINVKETIKFLVTYKNNEHKVFINGSNQGTDTSGSVPASGTFDRFKTDLGQNSFKYYGQLDKVILFPTALTDAQCIELTTL